MSNLPLHIEYLLRYHDCVIIPGIGAFMKSYKKAAIDANGIITPPSSELTFNASILSDDGLLAHSLMRRNNSSFEEARTKVSEAVDEIKNLLKSDREFTFGRIGTLTLSEEDKILYIPFPSSLQKVFRPITKDEDSLKASPSVTTLDTQHTSRQFNTKHNYYIAINKQFARIAAALIFVLAAASTFVVPSLRNNDYTAYQRASVMPVNWTSASQETNKDSNTEEIESLEATSQETADSSTSPQTYEHNYYLVVATFKTQEECDKFISSQPSGIASNLGVVTGKKVCRVFAASSDSREKLLNIMREDTFKALYSQAWIWQA